MPPQFDLGSLDPREIGQLMKLLAGTDVEECEIEQGEYTISIKRRVSPRPPRGEAEAETGRQEGQIPEEARVVLSPAVGVFYRSETRAAPSSAEVGTRVQVGDVLGSIEVMGVPHGVFSTHEGTIEAFLVDDGEPVEYGQPIVAIS